MVINSLSNNSISIVKIMNRQVYLLIIALFSLASSMYTSGGSIYVGAYAICKEGR